MTTTIHAARLHLVQKSLVTCLLLSAGCAMSHAGNPPISPQRTQYPSADGAISLYPIPVKRVITQDASAQSGLYIPGDETRNVVFRYLSPEPILITGARVLDKDGRATDAVAIIKSVGPVLLASGLEIGQTCPEHLRIGDTIAHGAIQNVGDKPLRVELAIGIEVTLKPGQGMYVGNDYYVLNALRRTDSLSAGFPGATSKPTHTIECVCTCDCGSGVGQEFRFACGTACIGEGNQCGMDGDACHAVDGDSSCDSTLTNCHEEIVPLEPDPSDQAERVLLHPHP